MPFISRKVNYYPPPIFSKAFIKPSVDTIDLCGALIVITAEVSDPTFHTITWEQVSGPAVQFTVSNNNQTLAFVRTQNTPHTFRVIVDQGLSTETSEDFLVTDIVRSYAPTKLESNVVNQVDNTIQTGLSATVNIGVRAITLNSGENPSEIWWDMSTTRLDFIRYEVINSVGTVVFTSYDQTRRHFITPVNGIYRVRAVFPNGNILSKRVSMTGLRNVNDFGEHLRTDANVSIGSQVTPYKPATSVVRQVAGSVRKITTTVAPVGMTSNISGFHPAVTAGRFQAVGKVEVTLLPTSIESTHSPYLTSVIATRLQGQNIG